MTSIEKIKKLLQSIPDPEIPVINIDELGVLRNVAMENEKIVVTVTPTYSGCPAMHAIEKEIAKTLDENGFVNYEIKTVLHPAWTTDWMNDAAKDKLRAYGIAPPEKSSADKNVLSLYPKIILCPKCGSKHTEVISQFGSTACKALYRCNDCLEPFDYFKCI